MSAFLSKAEVDEEDRDVDRIMKENKITIAPWIRSNVRPMHGVMAYHTTFVDEMGNFQALLTDGIIAWIKLHDGQIIKVQLKSIETLRARAKRLEKEEQDKKPKLSKSEVKARIMVLRELVELGVELPDEEMNFFYHNYENYNK